MSETVDRRKWLIDWFSNLTTEEMDEIYYCEFCHKEGPDDGYKFTQLIEESKERAIQDYIDCWKVTHDEEMTYEDARQCCLDTNNDVFYYYDGSLYEEED